MLLATLMVQLFLLMVEEQLGNTYTNNNTRRKYLLGQFPKLWRTPRTPVFKVEVDEQEVPIRKVVHTFKGLELYSCTHDIKFNYLSNSLMSILVMNIGFIVCFLSTAIFLFWKGYFK